MNQFKVGDIVKRKSCEKDIKFKISEIKPDESGELLYVLKGIEYRLITTSKADELILVEKEKSFNDLASRIVYFYDKIRGGL